jgi:hypothetical protein
MLQAVVPSGFSFKSARFFLWIFRFLSYSFILSTMVLFFRIFEFGGSLNRDEANGLQLALSSWKEIPALLQFDSFPLLWFGFLKAWISTGLPPRLLSLFIGIAGVLSIWKAAKIVGINMPVAVPALFFPLPMFIISGGIVRAYVLGAFLLLLSFVVVWDAASSSPRINRWVTLMICVASVHCLYFNAVIFSGIGTAGLVIASLRSDKAAVARVMTACFLCLISIVPYFLIAGRSAEWNGLIHQTVDFSSIANGFFESLHQDTVRGAGWIWLFGVLFLWSAGSISWCGDKSAEGLQRRDRFIYASCSVILGGAALALFLRWLKYEPWGPYFLGITGLICLGADMSWGTSDRPFFLRAGVGVMVFLGLPFFAHAWRISYRSVSNMGSIADYLGKKAAAGDLIVINDWSAGVGFQYYYRGAASWITFPDIEDHRVHRFDLMKKEIGRPNPFEEDLRSISRVLQGGGRVWVVTFDKLSSDRDSPGPSSSVHLPQRTRGGELSTYMAGWKRVLKDHLIGHAARGTYFQSPMGPPVMEGIGLVVVEGWRRPGDSISLETSSDLQAYPYWKRGPP